MSYELRSSSSVTTDGRAELANGVGRGLWSPGPAITTFVFLCLISLCAAPVSAVADLRDERCPQQ